MTNEPQKLQVVQNDSPASPPSTSQQIDSRTVNLPKKVEDEDNIAIKLGIKEEQPNIDGP